MNKWDKRYVDLAVHVSSWSKDRSTKVGAVIVGEAGQVIATGYNGFPRGVQDEFAIRHERPLKYKWTEHAERNAIYNAARTGTPTTGACMYVTWFPCTDCARAVIQSGIMSAVCLWGPLEPDHRWIEDFTIAELMMREAGVDIRWVGNDDEVRVRSGLV